jgi:hypothetical protein
MIQFVKIPSVVIESTPMQARHRVHDRQSCRYPPRFCLARR